MKTFRAQNINSKLPIVEKVYKAREKCNKCGFFTEFFVKIVGNEREAVAVKLDWTCQTDLKGKKLSGKCNAKMVHMAIVNLPRAKN